MDEQTRKIWDNLTEMKKLIVYLDLHEIPYELKERYGTPQVYYPNKENKVCDVICHSFSYGYQYGLLEIMGLLTEEEEEHDNVIGYLDAKDVFKRIYLHYEGIKR